MRGALQIVAPAGQKSDKMSRRSVTALPADDKTPNGTLPDELAAASQTALWEPVPLETLARLQGVGPVSDLAEIGALWPEDDDPDQLLAHILNERSARRKAADSGGEA